LNPLLQTVLDAHGGLRRWEQYSDFSARLELRGPLFEAAGWEAKGTLARLLLSLRTTRTLLTLAPGKGTILLRPNLISLLDGRGVTLATLVNPRQGPRGNGPDENTALRTSYDLANILRASIVSPYLYAEDGFAVEEIEPWTQAEQIWRGLAVCYPAELDTPMRKQVAYYGPTGLLRRVESEVDVMGSNHLIEDVTSYDQVGGAWIVTGKTLSIPTGKAGKLLEVGRIQLKAALLSERL
jgi:hypothetical protein